MNFTPPVKKNIFGQEFEASCDNTIIRDEEKVRSFKLNKYIKSLGAIEFEAQEEAETIHLWSIKVKDRNQGLGSKVMKALVEYADLKRKVIHLTASNCYGAQIERLVEFYERAGFEVLENQFYVCPRRYDNYVMRYFPKSLTHPTYFK